MPLNTIGEREDTVGEALHAARRRVIELLDEKIEWEAERDALRAECAELEEQTEAAHRYLREYLESPTPETIERWRMELERAHREGFTP